MPQFSKTSNVHLDTADHRLQEIFREVVKHFDCTVLQGYRSENEQNTKFRQGLSKVQFPNSRHNTTPSQAVDVAPYPIDWNDRERFTLFAGFAKGIAVSRGYTLRWGGDWNSDNQVKDNNFDDLPHFEIRG